MPRENISAFGNCIPCSDNNSLGKYLESPSSTVRASKYEIRKRKSNHTEKDLYFHRPAKLINPKSPILYSPDGVT